MSPHCLLWTVWAVAKKLIKNGSDYEEMRSAKSALRYHDHGRSASKPAQPTAVIAIDARVAMSHPMRID